MNNKLLAFILTFLIASSGFLITLNYFGLLPTVLYSIFAPILLVISRPVWLPDGYGKNKVRLFSLMAGLGLIGSTKPIWQLVEANWPIIQPYLPFGIKIPPNLGELSFVQMTLVVLIVFVVNYFMSDRSILSSKNIPFESDFPERNYNQKLLKVAEALKSIIRSVDHDLNWSAEYFTPLEAEVEISGSHKREVTTLLKSIKSDKKSRKFLIIGDPGSGKSVSLRKLTLEMLDEVQHTGKLPLYINLKEWNVENAWSDQSPPTSQDLRQFVINKVSQKDHFVHGFFEEFFDKMFEHGRLFFIFDSFDEIPKVIDEDESSWLINELSRLFSQFLGGAHDSRGVLASRQFRKPTNAYQPEKILEIRPFSDAQIREALTANGTRNSMELVRILFKNRPDWVSIARNPFNASLLSEYFKRNHTLPNSQSELFEAYLVERLSKPNCIAAAKKMGLTTDQLIQFATTAAYKIFRDPNLGLEASQAVLSDQLGYDVKPLFSVLKFALIVRVSDDQDTVSFVHRRFAEYFISRYLIENPEVLDLKAIPTDSSGRDGLIMYCEIAPFDNAQKIADFCWAIVRKNTTHSPQSNPAAYREAILCVRFLSQAFRTRTECLTEFIGDFEVWVDERVAGSALESKHALEASGLLNNKTLEDVVIKVLRKADSWLTDSAIKACRHLGKIDLELEEVLIKEIHRMTPSQLQLYRNELIFSFSLSQAFSRVRSFLKYKYFTYILVGIFLLFIAVLNPLAMVFLVFFAAYSSINIIGSSNFKEVLINSFFSRSQVVVILICLFVALSYEHDKGGGDFFKISMDPIVLIGYLVLSVALILPYHLYPICNMGLKRLVRIHAAEAVVIDVVQRLLTAAKTFQFGKILLPIKQLTKVFLFEILPKLMPTILVSGGLFYLMYAFKVFEAITSFLETHKTLAAIMAFFPIIGGILMNCIMVISDRKFIKRINLKTHMERPDIQVFFKALHPFSYHILFERLRKNVDTVGGQWVLDDLPKKAETWVAQLDEKWMKLD